MSSPEFNAAHETVVNLVRNFADNLAKHHATDYNESAARKDYIDKFFIALGWDVNHDRQTNPYEQEVKVERNVSVAARVKKADYAFFLKPNFAQERFFVEAKRPSAVLDTPDNCFQTIRYAFSSAKAALSILTNFNELYIIDCRFRPDISTAANHIHKKFYFTDFYDVTKFGEIYYLFGRDAVADGALERYTETLPKPKGKVVQRRLFGDNYQEVDDAFLVQLEVYREELAKMFKRKNTHLDSDHLTEAVQRTIDRLVFIRFLEDKLIEPSTILDKFGEEPHPWKKFIAKSREFDKTYNGIIFKQHPVIDRDDFVVDDRVFLDICDSLADKYSPYHFNYIPIHILGSIYERFLGSVIVATAKRATVEQKPEVRKAGGVFYTPQYIVKYIVENTIGALLHSSQPSAVSGQQEKDASGLNAEGRLLKAKAVTPADVAKMRFADIACGSGSFLLGAYEYLLAWHTKYYNEKASKKEAKEDGCITNDDGTFALSFEQKKEILVNNIYGVDIDRQAYEVTQLSLFLKLLEDETQGTKQQFLTGHRETMLPNLNNNIVYGNALVDFRKQMTFSNAFI
ncbi:MAG TPA: DNA methyltransferase [Pyrinomonadaceae bacterium]|nr:DNA methyltransferase [Pyrinomonadaceae bacterium]